MTGPGHPADERARLLFGPILEPVLTDRMAAVADEVRCARLVAHMRPYLLSSAVAATLPLRAVIPAQRRATRPDERRLDDTAALLLARRDAPRTEAHRSAMQRRYPPTTPYTGGTR